MASGPSIPNPADAAVSGMQADLANYPQNYLVNAAAQEGGKVTVGGKTYDFTGLGNAAQSLGMSDQMAQTLLDIQNNYGAQFVQQRLADLQQSDPVGYAARKQLFDKILTDSQSAPPNSQMSGALQTQVNSMLTNAGQLDPQSRQQVQQGVRSQQAARGITQGNAPAAEEATATVQAQDALRSQQQQTAAQYLQSGVSPQDIQYRKIQQDLANLGAFQNNQTPEAQFASLSSAGNGAAPFTATNYQTPATLSPQQATQTGIGFGQQNYQTAQNQANPWLAGLSLGTGALNLAGNLGWQPFSTQMSGGFPTSPAPAVGGGFGLLPNGTPATAGDYAAGRVAG